MWLSVKRWVPCERKAEEEERKVKNQDTMNLGLKRWQKDHVRQRAESSYGCGPVSGVPCPGTPSSPSSAEDTFYLLVFRAFL